MARPLRLEHPGAAWHATSRGGGKAPIYLDDADRETFLEVVAKVVGTMRWRLHAYVLLDDHYHLVVETPEPNLSIGMRQVNGLYGQHFNRRHGRAGRLFRGRFKGILVEKGGPLLEVCRHVVLNPVRVGLAAAGTEIEAWPWSSYPYTAGPKPAPAWLETGWTLSQFGDDGARSRYRDFVREGEAQAAKPWARLRAQVFLGSEEFRAEAQKAAQSIQSTHSRHSRPDRRETPRPQEAPLRPTLPELLEAVCREYGIDAEELKKTRLAEPRALLAWLARHDACERLGPIAQLLGRDISRVSQLALLGEKLERDDEPFAKRIAALRSQFPPAKQADRV